MIHLSTNNFKPDPGLIGILIPDQKSIYLLKSRNIVRSMGQTVALISSKDRRFPNSIHLAASRNALSIQVEGYSASSDPLALGMLQTQYMEYYRSIGWEILNPNKPPKYYLRIVPQNNRNDYGGLSWHVIVRSAGAKTGPTVGVFDSRSGAVDWIRDYYGVNVLKGSCINNLIYSSNRTTKGYLSNPLVYNKMLKEELIALTKDIGKP